MQKFIINVTWQMGTIVEVKANNLDEAIEFAVDSVNVDKDGEYISDSCDGEEV